MLRHMLATVLVVVSLILPVHARTVSPDAQVVTAAGEAEIVATEAVARQQAINQALRTAIEQVVGVFVNAQTKVSNFEVLDDTIYTKADGFVSEHRVVGEGKKNGVYWVQVQATVSVLPLAERLKALGVLRQWTIATVLKGKGFNRAALDAAETAINKRLIDAGFRIADREVLIALSNPALEKDLEAGRYARVLQQLRDADVDILVMGQASHEKTAGANVPTYGGIVVNLSTVKARLDLKAIRSDTGELVAADAFEDRSVGSGGDTVSAQAVEKAGLKAADFLIGQVIKLPAATSAPVQLVVKGLTFTRARAFADSLKGHHGVRKVHQQRFGNNQAVYEIEFEGDANLLADVLAASAKLKPFKFDITSLSAGRIEAGAK